MTPLRSLLFPAALALVFAASAQAGSPTAQLRGQVVVRYDDLDLSNPADAKAMLQRLGRAAAEACGRSPAFTPRPGLGTYRMAEYRRCRSQALANAVTALHAPMVERLYAGAVANNPQLATR